MLPIDSSFETLPKQKTNRFLGFGLPPCLSPPSPFTKSTTRRQLQVDNEHQVISIYLYNQGTHTNWKKMPFWFMEAKVKSRHDDSSDWHWWLLVAAITVLVAGAASITIWRNSHQLKNKVPPLRRPPKGVIQKYSDALRISTQFFDVQRCNYKSL